MNKFIAKYKNIIFLSLIFLLEFALFRTCVQRDIIGSCPRNIDQAVFMRKTYHMYENIVSRNWGEVLYEISTGLGQGAFPIFGLIFLFLFGKSRLSLLLVNFTLFVLAQGVGFYYVKKMSNSNRLGYVFLGLFLMIQSPFTGAGDMFDYRMDFSAFCLYTCWIVAFMAAYYLDDKKIYYLSAVFCGMVLMFRSNTLAYLGIAFLLFECIFVFALKREKIKQELIKLIKYAFVVIISGGWYILVQIKALLQYYLTAHVTSDEPEIRMFEQGITNTTDYLLFYPRNLVNTHLGKILFYFILLLGIISVIWYFINKNKKKLKLDKNEWTALFAGICGFVSPFIVLTIDISKSAVVICTVAGAFVVIGIYIIVVIYNKKIYGKYLPYILAVVCTILGLFNYINNTTKTYIGYEKNIQKEMLNINQCIEEYIVKNNLSSVELLVDRVCDSIRTDVITVLTYEDKDLYVDVKDALNTTTIYSKFTDKEVDDALSETDLVVLSENPYTKYSYYPIDYSLNEHREYMLEYAQNNLIKLGEFSLDGDMFVIFGRGHASVSPTWDDWMSDEGNWISFNKQDDNQKKIIIEGNLGGGFSDLDEFQPIVSFNDLNIPCTVKVDDDRYIISIDVSSLDIAEYKLELKFSNSFIPSKLGISEDTRKLVVMSPDKVSIN